MPAERGDMHDRSCSGFCIEYREVECEAKTDRVCWGQFGDEVACTVVEYREVECEAKTDRRQIGPPEMRDL